MAPVVSNLADGEYTLELYRRTEASDRRLSVLGLRFRPGEPFATPASAAKDRAHRRLDHLRLRKRRRQYRLCGFTAADREPLPYLRRDRRACARRRARHRRLVRQGRDLQLRRRGRQLQQQPDARLLRPHPAERRGEQVGPLALRARRDRDQPRHQRFQHRQRSQPAGLSGRSTSSWSPTSEASTRTPRSSSPMARC